MFWWILLSVTAISAALLTDLLRRYAQRSGLIDHPNARSSHSQPTPRGGGLAIVATSLFGMTFLFAAHLITLQTFVALAGGGIAVAVVGFADDRHTLPARIRFAVHVGAALWCLGWLGGLPPLGFAGEGPRLGWIGYVLGTLAIVWVLNLFNFMDGIDGIAASEAVFITGAGAVLSWSAAPIAACAAAVVAAASAGFLFLNWPPAKIFMGDVGSGYLGYIIVGLAIAAGHESPPALWVWLILGGVFFVDATVTLARRSLRGDKVHEAHRSHAYQWLARRWRAHSPVTWSVVAINTLWLLPAARLAQLHPTAAGWILLGALAPLIILVLIAGAGRQEPAVL